MRMLLMIVLASLLPAVVDAGPSPDLGAHCMAALLAKQAGRPDAAVSELHAALDIDPNYLEAHWILAWVLHDRGQKNAAIAEFAQVARIDDGGTYGRDAQKTIDRLTAPPPPPPPPAAGRALVALTFDDGPDPNLTPKLLDLLRARGVKATFFMLGPLVKRYPAIVKRIADEGHEVAVHAWDHRLLTGMSAAGVRSQMDRTRDAIAAACGVTPRVMRPPYGGHNAMVRNTVGMPVILWDVDPNDWRDRNSGTVRRRIANGMRPGSIVLMHDIHATTVAAVPGILDDAAAKGLTPVTVSDLIGGAKAGSVWTRVKPRD